ncbi:hypothetical protein BGZ83_011888, partial [Gryganskiella cystojenkinii]
KRVLEMTTKLSPAKSLELVQFHLKNAREVKDPEIRMALCDHVDAILEPMKKIVKRTPTKPNDSEQALREGIATAYLEHANLVADLGHPDRAQTSRKRANKWGGPGTKNVAESTSKKVNRIMIDIATLPDSIFPDDTRPPTLPWSFPKPDGRVADTPQLVSCLGLLRQGSEGLSGDVLEPVARQWLQETEKSEEEHIRLENLATDLIRTFTRDEIKDKKAIAEILCLVPVLSEDDFRFLLRQFLANIDGSRILDIGALRGLAQLLQSAYPGHLHAQDLIEILGPISTRLQETHSQSPDHIFELTLAVSSVLDAMADIKVAGLKRIEMHEPLLTFLGELQGSDDPHLKFYASYAFQALLCVPDDESPWQATVRRTTRIFRGVSGLVSAVKGLDLNGFMSGLQSIQEGFEGVQQAFELAKTAYEGVSAVYEGEQDLIASLKQGLTFNRKRAWYSALRGADILIDGGELAKFRILVCGAVCRRELAFQWGICQRLENVAANPRWGIETRQGAVSFLEEIYRNDLVWGLHLPIKAYILDILKRLSLINSDLSDTAILIEDLATDGDATKQDIYRSFMTSKPVQHLLLSDVPMFPSPSLLDRVQKKVDVEADLRRIARLRFKERGGNVYVPPMAKANLQAPDSSIFPLIPMVDKFLSGNEKVLLLLGDSGVGKTTFNRELDNRLWRAYKPRVGRIPLLISLPGIDRPEKDLIAKHLRLCEFSEPQIRELKDREFVIICDGYDESQQTQNLYETNGLNKDGGWKAQMVISCRSEHIGQDYQDLFQPAPLNSSDSNLLFQAVLVPFSIGQVKEYIAAYVAIKRPLWEATDYEGVLEQIPSLRELVKNPFLLTLSLEVLPRLTDPGQKLAANKVTRVVLYDEFVTQWLERNKKRLATQDLSDQEKEAFESLSDDGFTQQGFVYLRDLAEFIYKEQGGNPVIDYSKARDVGNWKERFFGRKDDEIRLLRKAIPMTRNGNRFGFIHRSILEYGVSRAIYEPQKQTGIKIESVESESIQRRKSVDSSFSFEFDEVPQDEVKLVKAVTPQGPDPDSLLAKKSFLKETSVLQFLSERVHPEPVFREQLLAYIEASKKDKKWRLAAANAITILVRAGHHFLAMDLRGIKIPGADLAHSVFDSVDLRDADLRKVNFRGAWLRQTDLRNTKMNAVQFGEWPMLNDSPMTMDFVYSHDGSMLAAATEEPYGINVYSTSSWEKIAVLSGNEDVVTGLAFSPDDSVFATGGDDKTVRLYSLKPDEAGLGGRVGRGGRIVQVGSCLKVWGDCHTEEVRKVIFSPDGTLLASCSEDSIVCCCLRVFEGHSDSVEMAVFTGDRIVSASKDMTTRIWSLSTGKCLHVLEGHMDAINSVAVSSNGLLIGTASNDMTARLWNFDGSLGPVLIGHGRVVSKVVFSPDNLQVATSSWDGTVRLWDSHTGASLNVLQGHVLPVYTISFSRSGTQLASVGRDKNIRLWSSHSTGSRSNSSGHTGQLQFVSYIGTSADQSGQFVGSASRDNTVRVWNRTTGELVHILKVHEPGKTIDSSALRCMVPSPEGDEICVCSVDSTVRIYDVASGSCKLTLNGHEGTVIDVAYSPDGLLVATASYDKRVRVFDRHRGFLLLTFQSHTDALRTLAFAPSGKQVASSSNDNTVHVWDITTRGLKFVLRGHTDRTMSVIFSPDGGFIVSTSEDRTCKLWCAKTGALVHSLQTAFGTQSVVFSRDGKRLATASYCKHQIWVWDVDTGERVLTLSGHEGVIAAVVFTPDGRKLISAGIQDKSVRIWDAHTGQLLVAETMMGGGVTCLAVNPTFDGTSFMTGCDDSTVSVWRLEEKVARKQQEEKKHNFFSALYPTEADNEKEVEPEVSYRIVLVWTSTAGKLVTAGTNIQDTEGLSRAYTQLLKQRGAIGEPVSPLTFLQATKRMIGSSSATKVRTPYSTGAATAAATNTRTDLTEARVISTLPASTTAGVAETGLYDSALAAFSSKRNPFKSASQGGGASLPLPAVHSRRVGKEE